VNKTVSNLLYFFFAVVLVRLVSGVTTFIIARILTPADYGVWVTLLVVYSFAPIVCLGTVETLVKMYPYYTGRGEPEKARRLESDVFGSIGIAAGVLASVGVLFFLFVHLPAIASVRNLVAIIVPTACVELFTAFSYYRFTAHQNFRYVSFIDGLRSVALFFLIIPFSYFWGITGAAVAFAVNELAVFAFAGTSSARVLGPVRMTFDARALRSLVAVGFPITVIWWVYMVQTSADRLISMSMLGKQATGYYGLGASMVSALVLVPMVLGRVLYPKVNEEVGKNSGRDALARYVIVPTQGLGVMLPFLIGALIIITPELYRVFFPKYLSGTAAARILLAGAYFACLIRTGVNYLVAIDKQNSVLWFVVASLGVNVAVSVALVKLGFSIEGISVGTSSSGLFLALVLWKYVFDNVGYAAGEQYRQLLSLLAPFILCIALSAGLLALCRAAMPHSPAAAHWVAATAFVFAYGTAAWTLPPLRGWSRDLFASVKMQVARRRNAALAVEAGTEP
jgi:O-antigen/teichoic acid export membrane protein